jgi:hypothetical protein
VRVLHSADWQLGKAFGRFEPGVRAALTEARFDAIDAIGQAARTHDAGHVLVAGDVFDTEGPEDRTIVQALSRMERYPCRWWLLPGNHDYARNGGLRDRVRARRTTNVTILTEPDPLEMEDGVWLLPAPLTHRHNLDDPTAVFDTMRRQQHGFASDLRTARSGISDHGARPTTRSRRIAPNVPASTISRWGIGTACSRSAAVHGMPERRRPTALSATFQGMSCWSVVGAGRGYRSPRSEPVATSG